jgi:PIN domain nuclease of toxin-antitoxin system
MDILLDTHTFIWFLEGDDSLPENSRNIISEINNKRFLSIASIWELSIKYSTGKLKTKTSFSEIGKFIVENDIELLSISLEHLAAVLTLPFHHRDSFDRLIIAQGMVENLQIITKDKDFKSYNVDIIWE